LHAKHAVKWRLAAIAILFALGVAPAFSPAVRAQVGVQGQWRTLGSLMPINPIHLALMSNGKVLIVAGSGNVATVTNYQAGVWDPQTESFITQSLAWDMFCNGMVVLPDGRPFINGGTLQYDPFHGQPRSAVFDPATSVFTDVQNMAHGRWYPTVTTLGDGRVMTFSGLTETGATSTAVEIYTVGSGWSPEFAAGWTPPLYPRMHLLTDGRVFYSGSGTGSRIFNPSTNTWSGVIATTNYAGTRTYGTSVLLPLTPANGYKPRVMIFGGGNPATATTEIIDMSATTPAWQFGPPMSQPRIEMNATILPNGKVLALGGSLNDEDTTTASLNADLYDPATNTFSSAGRNVYPRVYHSGSLLLPDATVLLMGGNPARGSYEQHTEIYSPAYLFNADGSAALRPTISAVTPWAFTYGGTFQVQTPDAANIASVVLVRPGAATHAFDMDQRLVGLSYTVGTGVLNVTAPPNGNIAPPGYYMLFALNTAGVPSVATFVLMSRTVEPVVTMTAPPTGGTVSGANVTVSANATDSLGVTGVQFKLDGNNLGAEDTSSPYSVTWDSTQTSNGTHTLTAVARDPAGRTTTSAPASVTVANGGTSGAPTIDSVVWTDGSTNQSSITSPAFSTAGPNELVLAFVATDYLSGANTTVTGVTGAGLTWTLVGRTNVRPGASEVWRALATAKLTNATVTASLSQPTVSMITLASFANVDTTGTNGSGAIGATASASAVSGAPSATLVTTRNNSWVFGVGNDYDRATARTPGANQTIVHQALPSVGDTYWVQRTLNPTPTAGTSVTINDTAPTSDQYNLFICEIRGASGPPDTVPPSVQMTAPANGATVSGTAVTVSANASDNVAVAGVQFLLDGGAIGTEVTTAPYTIAWNSTSTSNGAHTLSARARDAANNTTTSAVVNVTVSNTVVLPPAIDVVISGDQPNNQTTVATPAFSTSSGNELLLAFVATDYLGGTNTTVTGVSGAGLTWQLVQRTNVQAGTSEIWRAFATAPLTNAVVTATLSQAVGSAITVATFSNVDTTGTNGSGAIGATASANASSGAPAATLVTTRGNSLVFGVGNDYDSPTARTVASGQTLVHQYFPPPGDTYWVQRTTNAIPAAGTSVTISDTAPTSDRYNLAICEIRRP